MGLFAHLTCLRRNGTAQDFAPIIRGLLQARNVVEAPDPATADRLLLIAPAGDGWLMVVDHVEDLSTSTYDSDRLLAELIHAPDAVALDIIVADSDQLVLSLHHAGNPPSLLVVGHGGIEEGAPEALQRLLLAGQSVEDIRTAFSKPTIFIEALFPALKPLFGVDLAAFRDSMNTLIGAPIGEGSVLLRLKAVPAPGQVIGPPRLDVNDAERENTIRNRSYPQIPLGLITNFPGFTFKSRGGAAQGLDVRLAGSALAQGLIEIVSAELRQQHPTDSTLNRQVKIEPELSPAGAALRFEDIEVPDWLERDPTKVRAHNAPHDLLMFLYCRALRVGEGELEAEAHLITPQSAPIRTSCPVIVLPEMWRPLRSTEQPAELHAIRSLNRPTRINALAVLSGAADEAVRALRMTLETWRSRIDPAYPFSVAAATETPEGFAFFWPADLAKSFSLDLRKKRNPQWDRLMADLPSVHGLRIATDLMTTREADYAQRQGARVTLQYTCAATHPRLPDYAARLGHVSLSLPASPATEQAVVSLMQTLAEAGLLEQAYVAAWDSDDEPKGTIYERATDNYMHLKTARGWGTRYLRAVADRLWLGPKFTARLPDRAALERLTFVRQIGETLSIERRPEATLRDLELCLALMLPTQAEGWAFGEQIMQSRAQ